MTAPLPPLPEEDEALAAELALGLLTGEERRAAERRAEADPAFRAAVAAWSERLAPLADDIPEVAPPPGALAGVQRRLGHTAPPRRRLGLLGAVEFLLGGVAAAVLVAWLAVIVAPFQPAPVLLATLAGEAADGPRFEARYEAAAQALVVVRVAGEVPPAEAADELWIIAPGAAPVSLGLIGETPLRVDYPLPPAGWTLAVSREPAGGSPTGAPTGPVIAAGAITDV